MEMSKADLEKEIQRYREMDEHRMIFGYKDYIFFYTEDSSGAMVDVRMKISNKSSYGLPIGTFSTKPLNRRGFETWCICWTVDKKEE